MHEEIEILRSRTDELLVQVLSQWSQSVINCPHCPLPPFCALASCLNVARDGFVKGAGYASRLESSGDDCDSELDVEVGRTERHFSVDIKEHEVTTTGQTRG